MEPIDDGEVALVAQRYTKTLAELEVAPGEALLVLPNGDFFPDVFRGDAESLEALIARLSGYAGLEHEVELRVSGQTLDCADGGCGTGACGSPATRPSGVTRPVRLGERWALEVAASDLGDPIVMTARLATALSAVCYVERAEVAGESLAMEQAELGAVALGFGVLELEASHIYKKGCGGPQVARATALDCRTLSIALSLFLAREKLSPKHARSELGATQSELLDQAWEIVSDSPALVDGLRSDPARVAAGRFKLHGGGSWFGRWFGKRGGSSREDQALAALERGASVDEVAALLGQDTRR